MKVLDKIYDKELQVGDIIIYQTPTIREEGAVPMISIELAKITSISEDGTQFDTDKQSKDQPVYRIRYVVKSGNSLMYAGHSQADINLEEGQIGEETHKAWKEREQKDLVNNK